MLCRPDKAKEEAKAAGDKEEEKADKKKKKGDKKKEEAKAKDGGELQRPALPGLHTLSCSLRTGAGEKDSKKDKGGKKEKGKGGKKEKGKDGKKEDKGEGKEKKGKGDGKGDGGKKGDGDAESQDGDAKSPKKALKDLKKQSTKDAGSKSGMLNTEDREVMEKLGAAMSKDKYSASAQSSDMEQSGDSSPTKSADKKGVFSVLGGTSLGQSKDVEETQAEKEQRLAAERDEHLEKRRSAKQAILYAYGGAKRGWLIQLFDVDTKALLDKKSGKKGKGKDEPKKSGKTFMDSEVIYCVARQTSALGEFYTFDSDEVSRAHKSATAAVRLSRSSSVLCRRRRKEIRTTFLAR